jgi:hypothetical protein
MVVDVSKVRRWAGRRFKIPAETDPAPEPRHLAKIMVWAAALSIGGIGIAFRALIRLAYERTSWHYVPLLVLVALVGIAAAIGAIASVHRSRIPIALLGLATVALAVSWLLV